ncbi:NAD(P)-dependent oxidoreductase [Pseudonocardia adelaidensis]|uniref:NAD(P)-dependent oxidoreductase n=1 Tax=Pseudonocardia adelaidensis TaxID=648754 RepID=UPI0031E943AA
MFGQRTFSDQHAWHDLLDRWRAEPRLAALAERVVVETVVQNGLTERLCIGDPPVDVVVPMMSEVTATAIRSGTFGLIQQFGSGVDRIDLPAAQAAGVWVANMPGLTAVHVAEHAVALLLALARRLPEADAGFAPGGWGSPAGRSLVGARVCIVGLGAIGTAIAARLAAFDVELVGIRRTPPRLETTAGPVRRVLGLDSLHAELARADAVIIAANHERGRPPVIDRAAIAAMKPGALLVNIARGALLEDTAAAEAVRSGHLDGLALDVFPTEPYPEAGPLRGHPRIITTAHTAALTDGYFQRAGTRLADAVRRYLDRLPPDGLVQPT